MGFFRVQLGVVARSEGHSALKRSAYQRCTLCVADDGRRHDFRRKRREHRLGVVLAPPGSPGWALNPNELWRRAAAAESRIDAQEARVVDFSMPREVPEELWEPCIRFVYAPFVEQGMAVQADLHDTPASDGGRNVNVHALVSLRLIDGDGFARTKQREWNEQFRARGGRDVRERFAARLTAFCAAHGIAYEADARPNSARGLPAPEQQIPRWNFEAGRRGTETEVLAALRQHRQHRRAWENARDELAGIEIEIAEIHGRIRGRGPRIVPADGEARAAARRDRKAAVLRAWHQSGWIDAGETEQIARARFDPVRECLWIDLRDGRSLIDTGDAIHLRGGPVTWTAAHETVAAARRHGWASVEVSGDQNYRDTVAFACLLQGIEVTNHKLSPDAKRRLEQFRYAERLPCPEIPASSREAFRHLHAWQKQDERASPPEQVTEGPIDRVPAYRPRPPRDRQSRARKRK